MHPTHENPTPSKTGRKHGSTKESWTLPRNTSMKGHVASRIKVPSFLRLFVIRRIIDNYITYKVDTITSNNKYDHKKSDSKSTVKKTKKMIENLLEPYVDQQMKLLAYDIVTRLITYGIKNYMSQYFNEISQALVIEMIFQKLILVKFEKEYNQLITYSSKNKDDCKLEQSKRSVFNSSDLMCTIFQYLEFKYWYINVAAKYIWVKPFAFVKDKNHKIDEGLFYCGLVNSNWFYHVWNINSIYYVDLTELVKTICRLQYYVSWRAAIRNSVSEKMVQYKINGNNLARMWQRLINVKYVCLTFSVSIRIAIANKSRKDLMKIVKRICLLTNVEKIVFVIDLDRDMKQDKELKSLNFAIGVLRIIMVNCKNKIKWCNIFIKTKKKNKMSPLWLTNVRSICINDLYFYVGWTNKCEKIILNIQGITKNWCNFVIQNCDCSGVKVLSLNNISFLFMNDTADKKDNDNDNDNNQLLLKKFILKFENLQRLEIHFFQRCDHYTLLFLKFLKQLIIKNNIQVTLILYCVVYNDEFVKLAHSIGNADLTISKINVGMNTRDDMDHLSTIRFRFDTIARKNYKHYDINFSRNMSYFTMNTNCHQVCLTPIKINTGMHTDHEQKEMQQELQLGINIRGDIDDHDQDYQLQQQANRNVNKKMIAKYLVKIQRFTWMTPFLTLPQFEHSKGQQNGGESKNNDDNDDESSSVSSSSDSTSDTTTTTADTYSTVDDSDWESSEYDFRSNPNKTVILPGDGYCTSDD